VPGRSPTRHRTTAITVRRAKKADIPEIVRIASSSFSGLADPRSARQWVRANWRASPRIIYWVAESGGSVIGYVLWVEKGGFRPEAVFELEQIAVDISARRRGAGSALVRASLQQIKELLRMRGSRLKLVEVTTGSEQHALRFYQRVLGGHVVATLPRVFRGDEHVLFARPRGRRQR
jgi:ribosomal protein S18 acetylase RimI-like enzyme